MLEPAGTTTPEHPPTVSGAVLASTPVDASRVFVVAPERAPVASLPPPSVEARRLPETRATTSPALACKGTRLRAVMVETAAIPETMRDLLRGDICLLLRQL